MPNDALPDDVTIETCKNLYTSSRKDNRINSYRVRRKDRDTQTISEPDSRQAGNEEGSHFQAFSE